MTRPNSTELIFVIDRSGSMSRIASDMEGSFNSLIAAQKKLDGECDVTVVFFSDTVQTVFVGKPVSEVRNLVLEPRGNTALLDALGETINLTGARINGMQEDDRPSKVLFVIITDGHDNVSKEFSRDQIFGMISHQREKYSWEFLFMGANQDSIAAAQLLGIQVSRAVSFAASEQGTRSVINATSNALCSYRGAGGAKALDAVQANYDQNVAKP